MRFVPQGVLKRLASLAVVLLAAALFSGVLLGALALLRPLLPAEAQEFLRHLSDTDLESGKAALVGVFNQLGPWRHLAFVGIQVLQVFFAPIPGQLTGFLGGFLFGFWPGLALTMGGLLLGSSGAMLFSRRLGRPFVRRIVGEELFAKFGYLIEGGGLFSYFMLFLLPALPDDAICFVAGLSNLPLVKLLGVCLLGRLPGMAVLTLAGASVGWDAPWASWIFVGAMGLSVVIWLYQEEIERWYHARTGGAKAPASESRRSGGDDA